MVKPRKLSTAEKWFLKYTDKPAYKQYKQEQQEYESNATFEKELSSLPFIHLQHQNNGDLYFKHSGNSGDIIYALPTVFALAKQNPIHLCLQANQKLEHNYYHPLGNVMLNKKMVDMLEPLLTHQPQVASCSLFNGQKIDYDLDVFREFNFPLDRGHIARWYFYVFGVFSDLSQPWLTAPKDSSYSDFIVIARSHRYRSPGISYSFLNQYDNLLFVGVPEEYNDMKRDLPQLQYAPVENFLHMATIIGSCKFFIGNQSFPFAIAEALKVTRVLEVFFRIPNVVVQGKGGYDFVYQRQFEKIISDLQHEHLNS